MAAAALPMSAVQSPTKKTASRTSSLSSSSPVSTGLQWNEVKHEATEADGSIENSSAQMPKKFSNPAMTCESQSHSAPCMVEAAKHELQSNTEERFHQPVSLPFPCTSRQFSFPQSQSFATETYSTDSRGHGRISVEDFGGPCRYSPQVTSRSPRDPYVFDNFPNRYNFYHGKCSTGTTFITVSVQFIFINKRAQKETM